MHGVLNVNLSNPTIIKKGSSEYHLFFMRTGVIVLKKYESLVDYHTELTVPNEILVYIDEKVTAKEAVKITDRVHKLSHGDDMVYAEFKGGRITRAIAVRCPAWFMERVDPRNKEHWNKILSSCWVELLTRDGDEFSKIDLGDLLHNIIWDDTEKWVEKLRKLIKTCRELGDDLLNWIVNRKVKEIKKEVKELLGIELNI